MCRRCSRCQPVEGVERRSFRLLFRHSLCVSWEARANSLLHLVSGPSEIELIVTAKGLGNLAQRAATREQREIDEPLARNGQEPGLLSINLNEAEGALRVGVLNAGRRRCFRPRGLRWYAGLGHLSLPWSVRGNEPALGVFTHAGGIVRLAPPPSSQQLRHRHTEGLGEPSGVCGGNVRGS